MKIYSSVTIGEREVQCASKVLRFEFNTPARGVLHIQTDVPPKAGELLEVAIKQGDGELTKVFAGFIESVLSEGNGGYQLLVRELAAILNRRVAINLRHCTAAQVLQEISAQTGAQFVLPKDSDWTKTDIPRFTHIGGGYGALDYLLRAFDVEKPCWHQQANGMIYVGELSKSLMGNKKINIDAAMFQNMSIVAGELPVIPNLRPGLSVIIDGQNYQIETVDITNTTMRLGWVRNLHATLLRSIQ